MLNSVKKEDACPRKSRRHPIAKDDQAVGWKPRIATTGFGSLSHPRKRLLARFVVQMTATACTVSTDQLFQASRGTVRVVRARQISMYLLHTTLSIPYQELGKLFGRDRTTIAHACSVVEDLRDTPAFDDKVAELENVVRMALELAVPFETEGRCDHG